MNPISDRSSFQRTVLAKITHYGRQAAELGRQARQHVFGFRLRSTVHIDRWALPVKLLYDHHVPQRSRIFRQAGGRESSIALHALEKARQHK